MRKFRILILSGLIFFGSIIIVAGNTVVYQPEPTVKPEKSEQTESGTPPRPQSPETPKKEDPGREKAVEDVKEVSPNQAAKPTRPRARPQRGARPEIIRPERGRPAGAGRPQGARRPN
jgi:cell division protein FtsN